MFLRIAIDTPLRRLFDYREGEGPPAEPGMRVWAPFGRRRLIGVVIERVPESSQPPEKLRSASPPLDDTPALDAELLKLLRWAADYYHHPLGEVIASALPTALRMGAPLRATDLRWRITGRGPHAIDALPTRAARLRRLYAAIEAEGAITVSRANELIDGAAAALRALAARELIESFTPTQSVAPTTPAVTDGPPLNEAQRNAVASIGATFGSFASHLLHGVTGSGKTEVYMQLIAQALLRGEQALVLVPEIALTPQLLQRFTQRFGAGVTTVHSAMTDLERLEAWRAAREGAAPIVIGTRSAVFTPLARPGLIIVDEEHDASFKQQDGFRYSARDLAIMRAQRLNIPIVLGSATPALETLERAQRHPQWLSQLRERAGGARSPALTLVDLRVNSQTHGVSTPALLAIERRVQAGEQVMVFLNRRGYAPVLFCPKCGWSAHCTRCDAHLTAHARGAKLQCHHCGAQTPWLDVCQDCHAPAKPVGQGTERIEEFLAMQFPSAPLLRIDRDAIRRKGELEDALERVRNDEVRILVGTQMLTKGHDFPNVTLVVVLNADQGLFSTDFRAPERLAQTIVQVAGRAGRAERPGEVLIQTEYPDHPLLQLLLARGYEGFAAAALAEREQSAWPPYARLALLRAEGATLDAPMRFLQRAYALGEKRPQSLRLLGPAPAPMTRRAGRHRAQLLVHAPRPAPMHQFLSQWIAQLEALPETRRVRWSIDVDPLELF